MLAKQIYAVILKTVISYETRHRALVVTFSAYVIATWTSMAAMEILGWLTVLLTIAFFFQPDQRRQPKKILAIYPWKLLSLLLLTIAIGLIINAKPGTDWLFAIGTQRYMLLLFCLASVISVTEFNRKHFTAFLIVISVIAVYAVFQSFTGIDLLRPGTNRAVQPLSLPETRVELWRSAGMFGSPMHYAYVAGMHSCFVLAYLLLNKRTQLQSKLFNFAIFAYCVVVMSVVTTFVRGAWAGLVVAALTMACMIDKKLVLKLAAVGTAALAILLALSSVVSERLFSVFNLSYSSNSDRLFLWKINWEMFKDYPLFGIGYHQNEVRGREYATLLGHPEAFIGHAHSNYLQMLSGTGAIGFTLYLLLISYMLKITIELYRSLPVQSLWWRMIALGSLGAQVHLHFGGLTEANFKAGTTNHNLMVIWGFVIAGKYLQSRLSAHELL